jgi:2-polyprenyl-3-methyl-5-hydroxy-6-metoxy-1,4-benzoquinol methylase
MDLIEQERWDENYIGVELFRPRHNDQMRLFLENNIPNNSGSCFEIGCYPGTYLSVLGDLGYQLNGIDLTPNTDVLLIDWLKSHGYNLGKIEIKDFYNLESNIKYDLVASFGFIEHFVDFEKVIIRHLDFIKKDGILVITTPNLNRPFYYFLHKLFNPKTLKIHNINSMNPDVWKKILIENGFEVIYSGFFGYFNFWIENEKRNFLTKIILKLFIYLLPFISKVLPKNNRYFSPYIGLVARNKK